ncbi:thioredoxin family protein [Chitinophaga polysaccharea]|uniref:thioredoxin family protein n=1 Tax=Chitinophaga polysaccharea TaxID=1293035 RepID=UPI001158388F|nr:thioredoxin fold domain-containing protein [Chitinophaga polysaccharea]
MMKKLLLLAFLLPLAAMAQDQGIRFEHALSWKEVKAKAKKEGKFIFMDCFTTWCGPCKKMSSQVFTEPTVGEFFREKFVSVKVQMDKTSTDDEAVKSWYADAAAIAKKYGVRAYPTFLYFSPEGKLVHVEEGSMSAISFLDASARALKPATTTSLTR